ncbi:T9SS type A sorting domain-containing protein [Tenacibaculum sp. M341]|uniref:T9SS type A sorting domain-containing protein n=1 Tax=Tenacibaculum sp. M341 TaxID=2530339 RepID=UPI0010540940|nr:T9SS type A sorting domain-containing protein [Tenacibaculum sp. M341]TCI93494.1 T9SS type A sorting domain-containing protein [Tenacibaculum sp. M341]
MNRKLPLSKKFSYALMVSAFCFTANAQQLKTQADLKQMKKSQVYKNQKMFDSKTGATDSKTPIERQADNAVERAKYEFERLRDPKTNQIPLGIRKSEMNFSSKIKVESNSPEITTQSKGANFWNYYNWRNRGPYNVGGRTRALAIDRTNENVILAGGVSGGLWRSRNGGETWRKVTRSFQSPGITTIVQDPRKYRGYIWYYASGERPGNSASAGGAFYQGSGVYKSQDGGRTWELLRATANENVGTFESAFDLINSIAVNPANGDLYVATFNGLYRSQDGGRSFEEVLAGGFDNTVEVSITPSGRIYATIDSGGDPNAGFFTSTDGENWTNITPESLGTNYGRTVMGVDPANENLVYFLSQSAVGAGGAAFLHRYNNETAEGEEAWANLSANLPVTIGGRVGNFNPQGGYNLVVKVHPADSNIVFVGGTNLYRSTDAFATPVGQESWVAGYSPLNNVSLYTNQHPDQHALVFYPSNPNRALSGNDGGVYVTEDITATNDGVEPVQWESLNNGYLTTQPYHVAFDPNGTDDNLVAGFQDNGTWFTNSSDPKAIWEEDFGGDGAYSAIADNGRTRYVSSQRGNVFRFNFDENGEFEAFTSVRPAGPTDFSFINPFILDPNNDNIMYMPIGGRVWRNRNLDEIPLFSNAPATTNWSNISTSQTPDGSNVTALDVSTYPVANRLYYGTNSGVVLRMDNANVDDQQAVDITSGKGLPTGFVNDINVDPSNADRVIVTFSNYGIPSLFFTQDGGETWTDISGNLEENADGTGNGPSVRSTAFLGAQGRTRWSRSQRIYAATSTGLYSTRYLNGQNTVWRKENRVFGQAVTDEVVTRKDGLVAVASHGNGLFSARFPLFRKLPQLTLSTAFLLDDIKVGISSEDTVIDVTGLFVSSGNAEINIELTNSNPELVTATLENNILTLSYAPEAIGTAAIGLVATSGNQQVSEGFTVNVAELAIYEQQNPVVSSSPSQNFLDFGAVAQSADDFTVPAGNTWNINRITALGSGSGDAPIYNSATVVIYENNEGNPGEEIYNSGDLVPISDATDSNVNLLLPEALTLESGDYWISVYVNLAFNGGGQWFWSSEDNSIGQVTQFRDPVNLFGTGATDWTSTEITFGRDPIDQSFQIFGDIVGTNVQENTQEAALVTLESNSVTPIAWPNPSVGSFNFDLKIMNTEKQVSMQIFDMSGKVVHEESNINTNNNYVWNASRMATGFYFVNVKGDKTTKRFKILKK